jgi:hypothetical protein
LLSGFHLVPKDYRRQLELNDILKTIGYFWSDALNCFLFGHSPMTPTFMDVVMITGLDIASPSPSAYNLPEVPFRLSFKSECTNWGAYLNHHVKTKDSVTEKEHTTFLNFWLEHFILCGPSLAPTKKYLSLAYELAKGATVGLGKLFLGEIYKYLHLMSLSLLSQKKLKTSGPWWFIQLWVHLYFQSYIPNFPVMDDNSFPDQTGRHIRCTSYGQTLYSLPGSKLNLKDALGWFKVFYRGLDNPIFFSYTTSDSFENSITFRLDSFADDDNTQHLYSIMICPCFLPIGMSTSNRIIKPGYESYQPVVAARQLGLGQVPPHFFLHHLIESRADLADLITSQKCYNLFDDLHIPIPVDLSFTFSTNGFGTWWSMWKDHIFRKALGLMLQQIDADYEASEGEVFPQRTPHDLLFNFSLNCLSLLQQQDGPELEHDELSFSYLPAAPVVLFCKNAPPMSKIILDRQTDCSRLAFK